VKRLGIVLLIVAATLAGRIYAESEGANLIVTLKDGQGIGRLNRDLGLRTIRQVPGQSIYLEQVRNDPALVLQRLRQDRSVESAEADQPIQLNAAANQTISGLSTDTMFLLDRQTMDRLLWFPGAPCVCRAAGSFDHSR